MTSNRAEGKRISDVPSGQTEVIDYACAWIKVFAKEAEIEKPQPLHEVGCLLISTSAAVDIRETITQLHAPPHWKPANVKPESSEYTSWIGKNWKKEMENTTKIALAIYRFILYPFLTARTGY